MGPARAASGTGGRVPLVLVACLLALSHLGAVSAEGPYSRAEFQVKKFLRGDIEKGAYTNVSVTFIPGRVPELILYDKDGREAQRMFVDKLTYDELHVLVQSKGFKRKGDAGNAAAAAGAAAAASGSVAGPVVRQEDVHALRAGIVAGHQQHVQGMAAGGAAGAGAGAAHVHHHRHKAGQGHVRHGLPRKTGPGVVVAQQALAAGRTSGDGLPGRRAAR